MADEVALPPKSKYIHIVFHISLLHPYKPDYKHVIDYEPIQIEKDLSYEEFPIQIVDRKEHVIRNKVIPYVNVIWRNHSIKEVTYELEDKMKQNYSIASCAASWSILTTTDLDIDPKFSAS